MIAVMWRAPLIVAVLLCPAAAVAQDPHAGHGQQPAPAKPSPAQPAGEDHSSHMPQAPQPKADQPREPIPPITDADRAAAFPPDVHGHATHDKQINTFVLFDQFEWQGGDDGGFSLDNKSWIGGDINRLWVRVEGESADGDLESAQTHVLYGRSFARWWDVVAGARVDFEPGPAQTWAAVGIQGLAPYWFEIEATGYIGPDARTHARFEVEYELLFTNRLVLQPLVELELYGKSDPERGIGAGLSSMETGVRIRYEVRREFAPYAGITWDRKFFGTADFARAHGEDAGQARLALGVRTWF
jgi:copper resistance protein B